MLLTCLSDAVQSALNLTAAADQARLLQKETAAHQPGNDGSYFFTNVGPNSFEYRGMFAPGQTPVDFHKNFQELFDKFPDFPEFDFPKVVQQPGNPTPAPVLYQQQPYPPQEYAQPPRRASPTTRAPKVIPQYELYRIRTTPTPRVNSLQPVGRQLVNQTPVQPYGKQVPLVNQVPVQPQVNHLPVQHLVNHYPPGVSNIPVQPLVNPVQPLVNPLLNPVQPLINPVQPLINPVQPLINPVQPLINPVQPLYHFSVPTHAPRVLSNPVNQVQPLINPFQPFVNQVVQPVQPKYHIPTIAPRIEHDDQPYINPEQQPFQFPVDFPEYHLVRGVTRAESYPKIFTFTDGRINIVDFERKKKKGQGKKTQYGDGLDPDQVSRDQFLILHGGYYSAEKVSLNNGKYDDNALLYKNVNDIQKLQKLTPNLAYFYRK